MQLKFHFTTKNQLIPRMWVIKSYVSFSPIESQSNALSTFLLLGKNTEKGG